MSVKSDIRDGLIAIWRQANVSYEAFSGTVTAVDLSTRSCTVVSVSGKEEVEYTNVWLMPCMDDGILYTPAINSTVIVENNKDLQPYVVMWSAITAISYVIGGTMFKMSDGLTQFNKGDNGGIPNVGPVADRIKRLEEAYNTLAQKWDAFCTAYVPGSPTTVGTPATLAGSTVSQISPLTQKSDIEDTKVTH